MAFEFEVKLNNVAQYPFRCDISVNGLTFHDIDETPHAVVNCVIEKLSSAREGLTHILNEIADGYSVSVEKPVTETDSDDGDDSDQGDSDGECK